MLNVLILSDEARNLYALFKSRGYSADSSDYQRAAKAPEKNVAASNRYDIAFLDLELEGWREKLIALRQRMPVIAFSTSDLGKAVEAMKLGATDFLAKPLTDATVSQVLSAYRKEILNQKYGFDEIIGLSRAMQGIFGLIQKAAASESNVLITGESGTGKELLARAIHRWSPRIDHPFITINCSAIPDTLLESELFGFEKGAFTGANYTKKGLVESADGGTLFFDEIGDVTPLFQIKILRMLQEGEIMRIGGLRPLKVSVRIIAATNRELRAAVAKGAFREDLFYRLNVIHIHLPPLRERMEDVRPLARHFLEKHSAKRKDLLIRGISEDAMNILTAHDYPGNVRELENIIERAISFASSPEILHSDLPPYLLQCSVPARTSPAKLRDAVRAAERESIIAALTASDGNISRAAVMLGIYRQQLQRKIKSLRITI
jgi:DNA-binding NtrC family response regulator